MKDAPHYQRILVAMDFSSPAEAALQQAVWIAKQAGSQITLAHVMTNVTDVICETSATARREMLPNVDAFQREMRRESDARMQRMIDGLRATRLDLWISGLFPVNFGDNAAQNRTNHLTCGRTVKGQPSRASVR